MKIIASKREAQGTGASRRLRHADLVPGIVYGGKAEPTSIETSHNELFHALRKEKFHASVLALELDGKEERVLLRAFQMHPWKPQVMHVDFQRVAEDEKLHMKVPLHFTASQGLVSHVKTEIEIACLPRDLPEFITVDLSALKGNETVRVLDLKLPEGVSAVLKGKENPVLVSVTIKGGTAEEETGAPVAAAEVPATAQKAPAAAPAPAAAKKK
jgi:large subunit ribosomal protein L25